MPRVPVHEGGAGALVLLREDGAQELATRRQDFRISRRRSRDRTDANGAVGRPALVLRPDGVFGGEAAGATAVQEKLDQRGRQGGGRIPIGQPAPRASSAASGESGGPVKRESHDRGAAAPVTWFQKGVARDDVPRTVNRRLSDRLLHHECDPAKPDTPCDVERTDEWKDRPALTTTKTSP